MSPQESLPFRGSTLAMQVTTVALHKRAAKRLKAKKITRKMATILDGIVIGGAGGAIAGLTVWFVQYTHDKIARKLDHKMM
jgi:hypothetical protein